MKLRYRLFLWIGSIFLLTFGVSLFFETYTTDKNLKEADEVLRDKILNLNEERRQHLDEYLHISLSADQAKVNSLLLRLSRDPTLGPALFLDPSDADLEAPAHSAFLFKNSQWIDFLQTTKNGEITSVFIPVAFPMQTSYKIPIDNRISWVLIDTGEEQKTPFLGVHFVEDPDEKRSLSFLVDELIEVDWGLIVLFDPKALLSFKTNLAPKETAEDVEDGIDLGAFIRNVQYAAEYLRQAKDTAGTTNWLEKEIRKKLPPDLFSAPPPDEGIRCLEKEGEALNTRIIHLLQRGDQAMMISALGSTLPGGAFGDNLFTPMSPKGISRFPKNRQTGHSVLTAHVFFNQKLFDDTAYFQAFPPTKDCIGMGSSSAIITPPNMERVFVGNTLLLEGDNDKGFLTIATNAQDLLQDLVLSIHQTAFLVHENQVIVAFDEDGNQISNLTNIPFNPEMQKENSGIIQWRDENYYFLHMTPFDALDLHIFILETEKSAFALVNSIEEESREVIENVSFNMRIISLIAFAIVLLLLHNVAKRITKPITALAKVTEDVASGKLEGIDIPTSPESRHDEITTLCNSFNKMVVGLREKEKVKGILNKVVSAEIAEEIMKGQIHLGGEQRKVTVLFADIRNFTSMTEGKDPAEVIEMLNACMTKISQVIDEYGGVIDKYVGDEVMALFGAPIEKEDSALKAVKCGKKIIEVLDAWNLERKEQNLSQVEMGVGIHTGEMLAGNMGAENRLNYTVIGSNVNLAARMCGIAAKGEVLISKETLEEARVKENVNVEELPPTKMKGIAEAVILYRVKGITNA